MFIGPRVIKIYAAVYFLSKLARLARYQHFFFVMQDDAFNITPYLQISSVVVEMPAPIPNSDPNAINFLSRLLSAEDQEAVSAKVVYFFAKAFD